jgi:hypothetical protein
MHDHDWTMSLPLAVCTTISISRDYCTRPLRSGRTLISARINMQPQQRTGSRMTARLVLHNGLHITGIYYYNSFTTPSVQHHLSVIFPAPLSP